MGECKMNVLLLRFGELYLKGNNRKLFENALISNIKQMLKEEKYKFSKTFGRYVISDYAEDRECELIKKLRKVFGLYSLSPAKEIDADVDTIEKFVSTINVDDESFKVFVKRADKNFPISSMDFAKELGGIVLQNNINSNVDLYNPTKEIHVDIRLNGKAYVFTDIIKCQGGLPLGCSGNGLLLLSGGIDSPVAGYLMAKRGMMLECLHFHSYPYTSEQAKEKVITLAKALSGYIGSVRLHVVSFTRVQEEIHKKCAPEYMITIMRRIMMRVAEQIANKNNLGAIITGESLGQVASQTMQSMMVTGGVLQTLPIFRPCVAMDKEDIMKVANEIETYKTSILPYEDCCTVFLPKNPVIRPTIEKCEREEKFLNIEELVSECIEREELICIE